MTPADGDRIVRGPQQPALLRLGVDEPGRQFNVYVVHFANDQEFVKARGDRREGLHVLFGDYQVGGLTRQVSAICHAAHFAVVGGRPVTGGYADRLAEFLTELVQNG